MKKQIKLQSLKKSRERTLERIKEVKRKMAEEKENEESWPGHENTNYHDDLNQYELLISHLEDIEAEIEALENSSL